MARLFDAYIIADWTAAEGKKLGDTSLWIGVAKRDVRFRLYSETHNVATRAEGEALLGWLNATVACRPAVDFDANLFLRSYAEAIQRRLQAEHSEIAHLKMTFSPDAGLGDIAVVNLVRSDFVPELAIRLDQPASSGQVIVNLRAEACPEALSAAVREALPEVLGRFADMEASLEHLEHFRPGKPVPTHRVVS